MKLAANVTMLTRFRFDDSAILGMLTHDTKESFQSKAHAAILLASQPVEEFA
jgi:flagellar transcriptional activator FlhD